MRLARAQHSERSWVIRRISSKGEGSRPAGGSQGRRGGEKSQSAGVDFEIITGTCDT